MEVNLATFSGFASSSFFISIDISQQHHIQQRDARESFRLCNLGLCQLTFTASWNGVTPFESFEFMLSVLSPIRQYLYPFSRMILHTIMGLFLEAECKSMPIFRIFFSLNIKVTFHSSQVNRGLAILITWICISDGNSLVWEGKTKVVFYIAITLD